jgi:predicted dehydrogenase
VFSRTGYGEPTEKAGTSVGWSYPRSLEATAAGRMPEIRHLVGCIIEATPLASTRADGYRVLELVEAADESARTKQAMPVGGRGAPD